MPMQKLSIITINYNNLDGLKKTMESVFAQRPLSPNSSPLKGKGDVDFEYIVIDGASTDGSAEYIREHANKLTYWVSEKDSGIYNAMNKGVRAARGEYVLMLNSGDWFVDEHVVKRILPELDGTDIVQGNIIVDENGALIVKRGCGKSDISFIEAIDAQFLHQASFCRRQLFEIYGLYDESYRKNSDTYFYRKVLGFGNATFRYVDILISNFDMNGISNDPKWVDIDKEENTRWMKDNMSTRLQRLYVEAPKKIKLYDKIHRHKWAWMVTMLLVRIINRIENEK